MTPTKEEIEEAIKHIWWSRLDETTQKEQDTILDTILSTESTEFKELYAVWLENSKLLRTIHDLGSKEAQEMILVNIHFFTFGIYVGMRLKSNEDVKEIMRCPTP